MESFENSSTRSGETGALELKPPQILQTIHQHHRPTHRGSKMLAVWAGRGVGVDGPRLSGVGLDGRKSLLAKLCNVGRKLEQRRPAAAEPLRRMRVQQQQRER